MHDDHPDEPHTCFRIPAHSPFADLAGPGDGSAHGDQATSNLNLGVSAVYLDAAIDKVSADNAAFQGNTPANASKWQAVANAQYRAGSVPGLKLQGGVRYFGPTYTSDDNRLSVPGRTVAHAGLSYDFRWQGQDLTLIVNLNNVFDRKYWASGGWSSGNVGEARNLSLALRAQF